MGPSGTGLLGTILEVGKGVWGVVPIEEGRVWSDRKDWGFRLRCGHVSSADAVCVWGPLFSILKSDKWASIGGIMSFFLLRLLIKWKKNMTLIR